jgi:hypothetical protein
LIFTSPKVTLEAQLAALAEVGLHLNPGLGVADLLNAFDRNDYEKKPYTLVLFILGTEVEAEPWGRAFSDQAWNFDAECIEDTGSYVAIVRRLLRLTGQPDLLTDIRDTVDLEAQRATLAYQVGRELKTFTPEINDDWADGMVIAELMDDIETTIGDGRRFYGLDNGQATILLFLTEAAAAHLQALSPEPLSRMTAEI